MEDYSISVSYRCYCDDEYKEMGVFQNAHDLASYLEATNLAPGRTVDYIIENAEALEHKGAMITLPAAYGGWLKISVK